MAHPNRKVSTLYQSIFFAVNGCPLIMLGAPGTKWRVADRERPLSGKIFSHKIAPEFVLGENAG
jgi:hypothetical protein